ncbi:hypothetical protein AVEN_19625-1 [Araneus ventricosus]|uniref:Uncharacterized protein n=1 Tax=Araneus ventricosus TaxID=182803 RepID=A0A4Y2THK2_ARAVE|nr:hypothetical protein AVEN_19625-1 [Araneus ventricosus]
MEAVLLQKGFLTVPHFMGSTLLEIACVDDSRKLISTLQIQWNRTPLRKAELTKEETVHPILRELSTYSKRRGLFHLYQKKEETVEPKGEDWFNPKIRLSKPKKLDSTQKLDPTHPKEDCLT